MSRYVEDFSEYFEKLTPYFWRYIKDDSNNNPIKTHPFIIYVYTHKSCGPLGFFSKEIHASNICVWHNELIFDRIREESEREEHRWENYHSKFLDKIMENFAIGDKIAAHYAPERWEDKDGDIRTSYEYNWLTIIEKNKRRLTVKDENKFIGRGRNKEENEQFNKEFYKDLHHICEVKIKWENNKR